ncbi:MAG TPA: SRPBCC family protein [Vicinamibacteria bacterium]|nr:SRPBCC family protein [Vicinamibacteria bacterium]
MKTATTDRIEKRIQLRHARSRVWRALTDAREFGQWFGVVFDETFEPGARVRGRITHPGYEHMTMDITVERMEPERLFSWRWHPGAAEPGQGFADEPTTLVVFELAESKGGTLLTVVETGFDRIPLARRAKAFEENHEGWAMEMQAIEEHLSRSA